MPTLRIPFSHGASAGPLRQSAHDLLAPWCSPESVEDVLVVISELVQNVTQHTAGGGELVVTADHDLVAVEVSDASPVLPSRQQPDGRRLGGRGLVLVAGLTNEWGAQVTAQGKTVWARVALSPASLPGVAA